LAKELTTTHRNVILTYFEANMNVLKTARLLNYHPNSIYQSLKRIKFVTGKDPKNIHDLLVLVEIAKRPVKPAEPELMCVECGVTYKGKSGLYCPACRNARLRKHATEQKLSEIGRAAYSAKKQEVCK
jgi:hypothetical protein